MELLGQRLRTSESTIFYASILQEDVIFSINQMKWWKSNRSFIGISISQNYFIQLRRPTHFEHAILFSRVIFISLTIRFGHWFVNDKDILFVFIYITIHTIMFQHLRNYALKKCEPPSLINSHGVSNLPKCFPLRISQESLLHPYVRHYFHPLVHRINRNQNVFIK